MSAAVELKSPRELQHSDLFKQTISTNSSEDPAKEAYDEAVKLFKSKFTSDSCKRIWLEDKHGMKDVQKAVIDAQTRYTGKSQSKARKWLTKLSSQIMLYGGVLDTLVQYDPQYSSLAWGAIKFLLMGILNNEELIKELAKALCKIAEALPQADLYHFLYPTDAMKGLTITLYAHIITFIQRAVTWYSASKIKHAITAMVRPYSLHFKDLVENITTQVDRIYRLAFSMSISELRETRLELRETTSEHRAMRTALDEYHKLQYAGILDTSKRVCEIQFSQILTFTASSSLGDPDLALLFYSSVRNMRRRQKYVDSTIFQNSKQLQTWGNDPYSSMVLVTSSFQNRHIARDFAADIIDLLVEEKIPVIWALKPKGDQSQDYTSLDVLKQLVSQVLKQNHTLLNERSASLNAARFQSARTEDDWFNLLGSALVGLPQICIIIDLEALGRRADSQPSWAYAFSTLFKELRSRQIPTIVKVAFMMYRNTSVVELPDEFNNVINIPRKAPGKAKRGGYMFKQKALQGERQVRSIKASVFGNNDSIMGRKTSVAELEENGNSMGTSIAASRRSIL